MAMALNGGVSLAVWMGGCATELDCARRAHAGTESIDRRAKPGPGMRERMKSRLLRRPLPEPGEGPAPPERRVYNALCRPSGASSCWTS